jgi:hypothetical protein
VLPAYRKLLSYYHPTVIDMPTIPLSDITSTLRQQIEGLRGLVNVVHSTEQCTDDRVWLNYGQMLVIKVVHHLTSACDLAAGRDEQPGGEYDFFIDHSSIAVLVRAAFEASVVFHFIFCDDTPQTKRLRFNVWRLAALSSRLQLKGTRNVQERVRPVREQDQASVKVLQEAIQADALFQELSKDARNNALRKGNFRLGHSWPDLAEKAGVPRGYAADMYNHLCEYTHSGAVSTLQMRDASASGDGPGMASATLLFCVILLNELIVNYCCVFPKANQALLENHKLLMDVATWRKRRDTFAQEYTA